MSSLKEYIIPFQHARPSVEKYLLSIVEPSCLLTPLLPMDREPVLLIVSRVISPTRFLLAPLKAHQTCGVDNAFLTESAMRAVIEQFPGLDGTLRIGSIVEAKLIKNERPSEYFSHFVARVEKIWDQPLFPIHSTCNIVQMTLECDLSEKGRCRREIVGKDSFFVLQCKYGIEASIPVKRLMNYLEEDLTIKESTLKCNSIIKKGGPTSFLIPDTCKIIKKTVGKSDEVIPARTAGIF